MESAWMKEIRVSRVLPDNPQTLVILVHDFLANFQAVNSLPKIVTSASCQNSTKQFHAYRHASALGKKLPPGHVPRVKVMWIGKIGQDTFLVEDLW